MVRVQRVALVPARRTVGAGAFSRGLRLPPTLLPGTLSELRARYPRLELRPIRGRSIGLTDAVKSMLDGSRPYLLVCAHSFEGRDDLVAALKTGWPTNTVRSIASTA